MTLSPVWAIPAAGVAMFLKDTLSTIVIIADAHGHQWIAAGMSIFYEIASVASLGVGALVVWQTGSVWVAILTVASICTGSALASLLGIRIGNRLMGRPIPGAR